MKMKTIQTSTILISLLIILAPMTTQATWWKPYNYTIYQEPDFGNVRELDIVTVSIVLELKEPEKEQYKTIERAFIRWYKDDNYQTIINCDQVLPGIFDVVTFTLGVFLADDDIRYQVELRLDNAGDYRSSWIEFNVYPVTIPTTEPTTLPTENEGLSDSTRNILIGVIVAITVLVVVGLLAKRRRNR